MLHPAPIALKCFRVGIRPTNPLSPVHPYDRPAAACTKRIFSRSTSPGFQSGRPYQYPCCQWYPMRARHTALPDIRLDQQLPIIRHGKNDKDRTIPIPLVLRTRGRR